MTQIAGAALGGLMQLLLATAAVAAQNPVPLINQPLVPDTAIPGGVGFTLTVNGTGFVAGSVVKWNSNSLTTTFVNGSKLTAAVPASDIAKAGTASVTVVDPGAGGGPSNTVFFPVTLPVSFALGGSTFPAATGPRCIGTGDFNGDGKLDLVVPNTTSGNVSILLGNGDGTFQAPVNYAVGTGASLQFFQVGIGDFNGDGKLDFAISDFEDDYVDVFLGNGDGTFKPGVTYTAGQNPTAVAVADLNRDGKLDLIVSNQTCANATTCTMGTVSILLGNGNGTFQHHVDYDAGLDPNWVMVGDFNRDGKLDLAVVDGQGNSNTSAVLILLGNGDGTFKAPVSYPLSTNAASGITADFNGDGKLDIAVADNIGLVSILMGNGDGTFKPRVDNQASSFPWGSLAVGDFNQDGHLDLAEANSGSNTVGIFFGNGDGTFQVEVQIATGAVPEGVAVGDFNRDGKLDFALPNYSDNTVSVLLQVGSVALSPPRVSFSSIVGVKSTHNVKLTNTGSTALAISGIAITGAGAAEFSQSNNCPSSVAAGASCTIVVSFTPSQVGPLGASLIITDSGPASPQSVPLSGIGVISGPDATLSATQLTFATQALGTTSAAQALRLANYGTAALSISSIVVSGDFHQTNTCASSLAVLASCTISVTFKPSAIGSRSGAINVTDNATASPQRVTLAGAGTEVELNPSSLGWGIVRVGTTGAALATKLTNLGSTALSIQSIAIAGTNVGDFSQTNTCSTSVGSKASCTITVTFAPKAAGTRTAYVAISDNGGASPQQVPLSGRGCVRNTHGKCLAAPTVMRPAVQSALSASRSVSAPAPMGTSTIGTRIVDLVDSTREDPYLANGTRRNLMVRFWYPASFEEDCKPSEYTSPRVWRYLSEITGLALPEVSTNSCLDAPITNGEHSVVVFTHGYTGTFTDYTFLFEDLASRGYVVASIDHTYEATVVELPNGQLAKSVVGSHFTDTWRLDEKTLNFAIATRLRDLKFVVDELERMNTTPGNPFAGKLDTSRIALMGHSLGGEATVLGLQREPRIRVGIAIDSVLNDAATTGTEKALLILTAGREQWSKQECKMWGALKGPRLAVNLPGAEHLTPSDAVWLAKGAVRTGDMGPEKTIAAVRAYVAAFLDENLMGQMPSLLLGGGTPDTDVVLITQEQALCSQNPAAEEKQGR